jgi:hypothetical protein
MSWKAEAHKIYEARVIADALARLAQRVDLKSLPFSDVEVQTLAKRAREAFGSERKKERLEKYKAYLSGVHGAEPVGVISEALRNINNEIGYEEK